MDAGRVDETRGKPNEEITFSALNFVLCTLNFALYFTVRPGFVAASIGSHTEQVPGSKHKVQSTV